MSQGYTEPDNKPAPAKHEAAQPAQAQPGPGDCCGEVYSWISGNYRAQLRYRILGRSSGDTELYQTFQVSLHIFPNYFKNL